MTQHVVPEKFRDKIDRLLKKFVKKRKEKNLQIIFILIQIKQKKWFQME